MEVQRVPRAELLHGNLRVSLYGPRSRLSIRQMEQMELSSQPLKNKIERCDNTDKA